MTNGTDQKNQPSAVIVQELKEGPYAQEVIVGKHKLFADEAIAYGGKDLGPSPYDYLLAGLGACTSMTLRIYADSHDVPLEKTIVRLTHDKIYARDCADCSLDTAKIDHIDRVIELQGNLTQKQRDKLLEIANMCPVHRTLTSKISITTRLKD